MSKISIEQYSDNYINFRYLGKQSRMIEIGNRRKTSEAILSKIDIYIVYHFFSFLEPFFRACVDSVLIDSE